MASAEVVFDYVVDRGAEDDAWKRTARRYTSSWLRLHDRVPTIDLFSTEESDVNRRHLQRLAD